MICRLVQNPQHVYDPSFWSTSVYFGRLWSILVDFGRFWSILQHDGDLLGFFSEIQEVMNIPSNMTNFGLNMTSFGLKMTNFGAVQRALWSRPIDATAASVRAAVRCGFCWCSTVSWVWFLGLIRWSVLPQLSSGARHTRWRRSSACMRIATKMPTCFCTVHWNAKIMKNCP